jgi:hypothetical protein
MDITGATDKPEFKVFESASHSVEKALEAIRINPTLGEERGCFKAVAMHVINLAKTNEDYLAVFLLNILSDLREILDSIKNTETKTPITSEDYIKVLGYSYVVQNIMLTNLSLHNTSREILTEMSTILFSTINF